MVRVEKVFKEKDYNSQQQTPNFPRPATNFRGLKDDLNSLVTVINKAPVRNTLTIIGVLAVLYIGFKLTRKFVKIRESLRRL